MIVTVHVEDKELNISVGEGKQTVKWLSMVVQSRIEQYRLLKSSSSRDNCFYIVTEIKNVNNQLIHPSDFIYEHASSDRLHVRATVVSNFPTDQWESPMVTDWMKIANIRSEDGLKWMTEIEAWRGSLDKMSAVISSSQSVGMHQNNVLVQRSQNQASNFVQIGYDFSLADIESAFDLDWQVMAWDEILGITISEVLRSQLGEALKSHYQTVCNVFAHYCGTGQVGQRYGMTVQEFGHLLHSMRLHNFKDEENVAEELFFSCSPDSSLAETKHSGGALQWPLMTRAHFAQAVVKLSMQQHTGQTHMLCAAVHSLFEQSIDPFWQAASSKYFFYTCTDPTFKKMTADYYQLVKRAFLSRANLDSKFGPRLTISSFIDMILSSTMLEPEQASLCTAGFLEAQFNPTASWELEFLVLSEFVEALSRVAVTGIEAKSNLLTDAKRIRMAFNFMAELASESSKHHK